MSRPRSRCLEHGLEVVEIAHLGVHRPLDLRAHEQPAQAAELGVEGERQPGATVFRLEVVAAMWPHWPGDRLELEPSPGLEGGDDVVRCDPTTHGALDALGVTRADAV